jgi:hypothetical protein
MKQQVLKVETGERNRMRGEGKNVREIRRPELNRTVRANQEAGPKFYMGFIGPSVSKSPTVLHPFCLNKFQNFLFTFLFIIQSLDHL